jgi:hypothetical protein
MKDTVKTMTLSASTGQVIPTVNHQEDESLDWVKDNDEIRAMGERLFAKRKGVLLKGVRILAKGTKVQQNDDGYAIRVGKALILLVKFVQKHKNIVYKAIKMPYIISIAQKKPEKQLFLCINRICQKKKL